MAGGQRRFLLFFLTDFFLFSSGCTCRGGWWPKKIAGLRLGLSLSLLDQHCHCPTTRIDLTVKHTKLKNRIMQYHHHHQDHHHQDHHHQDHYHDLDHHFDLRRHHFHRQSNFITIIISVIIIMLS